MMKLLAILVVVALIETVKCDSLSSKAGKLTTGLLKGTIKGTSKAGYYLVQPRHVEPDEVYGLWRLQLGDGGIINLEVTPDHVILVDDGRTFRMPYKFHKARWPVRARIEFQTKQFGYTVVLHRKVAARNIIKMKGKITRIGRWSGRNQVLDTFVGKRRLTLTLSEADDEAVEGDDYDSEVYHGDSHDEDVEEDSEEREMSFPDQEDGVASADERTEGECEYDEESDQL